MSLLPGDDELSVAQGERIRVDAAALEGMQPRLVQRRRLTLADTLQEPLGAVPERGEGIGSLGQGAPPLMDDRRPARPSCEGETLAMSLQVGEALPADPAASLGRDGDRFRRGGGAVKQRGLRSKPAG